MENQRYKDSSKKGSFRVRHFAERIDEKRRLLRLVCEAQPLITLTSYDLPKRCPPVRAERPNQDSRHERRTRCPSARMTTAASAIVIRTEELQPQSFVRNAAM